MISELSSQNTIAELSEARADWYAKHMPKDHPYARYIKREADADAAFERQAVEGLVTFADGSRYGGAR